MSRFSRSSSEHITRREFDEAISGLYENMERLQMSTQDQIDAVTDGLVQLTADLGSVQTRLQAEFDSLSGQGVDVSGLVAAAAPLDGMVLKLGQITPDSAPEPAPDPAPDPVPALAPDPTPDPVAAPPAPDPTPDSVDPAASDPAASVDTPGTVPSVDPGAQANG